MILYFQNSNNEEIEIGRGKTLKEINKISNQFLKDHNFKSYYTRVTFENKNRVSLDFGSHIEFFIITNEDDTNVDIIELYKEQQKQIN